MSFKNNFLLLILIVCFYSNAQDHIGDKAPFISKSYESFKSGESLNLGFTMGFLMPVIQH